MENKSPKLFLIKDFDTSETWSQADMDRFKDGLERHLGEQIKLVKSYALAQISTNYKTEEPPSISKIGQVGELGLLAAEYDDTLGWNILCYITPGTRLRMVISYENYNVIFEHHFSEDEQFQDLDFGSGATTSLDP